MKNITVNRRRVHSIIRSEFNRLAKTKRNNDPLLGNHNIIGKIFFEPESVPRKNLELGLTIFLGLIAVYFAYQANKLTVKYGEQQDQIKQLKTIAESLNDQNKKLEQLTGQSIQQSKSISDQLSVLKKEHSNDSLQFTMSLLKPNFRRLRSLLPDIQLNEVSKYRIIDSVISFDVIEPLNKLEKDVSELMDNPIFLLHPTERDKCVAIAPQAKVLLDELEFYTAKSTSNNYFGEKRDGKFYFKQATTIDLLNKQFEELQQRQFSFVLLAASYYNKWYKMAAQ